jgi:hypothetical protein
MLIISDGEQFSCVSSSNTQCIHNKEEAQYMGTAGRSSEKRSFDQSLIFDDGLLNRSTVALVPKNHVPLFAHRHIFFIMYFGYLL